MATKKKPAAVVEDAPVVDAQPVELPPTTVPVESVDLQEAKDGEESMTINDFVSVVRDGNAFAVNFVTFDDGESMLNVGFPDLAGAEAFAEKVKAKLTADLHHLKNS